MAGATPLRVRLPDDFPCAAPPLETIPAAAWRNGLAIRVPNWLGDAMMTLPAILQLRKILPPHCGLFAVGPGGLEPVFKALPMIDCYIGLENLHRPWRFHEWLALHRLRPGVGLLFNNSLRDAILFRLAMPVGKLYGAAKRGRACVLSRAWKFPGNRAGELGKLHHANKYTAMAQALGAPAWDGALPEWNFQAPVNDLPPQVFSLCEHPKLLILAAGAAYGAAKRWPGRHFAEVARRWLESGGIVAAVGGKSERDVCQTAVDGLPAQRALNLAGKTDLDCLMQLLRHARCAVANDSGVMHLAAALGTPGVAVFGPTDYSCTAPIGNNWEILWGHPGCAPCFRRVCPDGTPRCMDEITADDVWPLIEPRTRLR